jgi:hypothetical protein
MVEAPRLVLRDSVSQVGSADSGALVVTGSHGGISCLPYAASVPVWLYVFNDAGVGKDSAGIAVLAALDEARIAAVTVAHSSARIGEARDAWEHGVVSHVNRFAAKLGVATGRKLSEQLAPAP